MFDAVSSSPATKQARMEEDDNAGPGTPPFNKPQSQWLNRALGNALETFGAEIEQRFDAQDEKLLTQQASIAATTARTEALEKHLAELQAEIDKQSKQSPAAVSEEHLDELRAKLEASCISGEVPYEQRSTAICGNLGEPTSATVCAERARAILLEVGVPADDIKAVAATRRVRANMAEISFADPATLRAAKLKVDILAKTLSGDRPVWLDAARTRAERRPVRLTHRAYDALRRTTAGAVYDDFEKDTKNLVLKKGAVIIGYATARDWAWTTESKDHFSEQDLAIAYAYATMP